MDQLQHQNLQDFTDCSNNQLGVKKQFNLIPLLSLPGAGNTWTRFLIEQSTGFLTGSIYSEAGIVKSLKGELENPADNNTIAVKAHSLGSFIKKKLQIAGCVVILRNPKDAILSDFTRRTHKNKFMNRYDKNLVAGLEEYGEQEDPEDLDLDQQLTDNQEGDADDVSHYREKRYAQHKRYRRKGGQNHIAGLDARFLNHPLWPETKNRLLCRFQSNMIHSVEQCHHNIHYIFYEKLKESNLSLISEMEKLVKFLNHNLPEGTQKFKFRQHCLMQENNGDFHRSKKQKIDLDKNYSFEEKQKYNSVVAQVNSSLHGILPSFYLFEVDSR